MNTAILHPNVQQFISDHLNTDISKLIFKGSPFNNITIQEIATQIVSKKKSEKKLPTWFQTENIYYPPKVNIEQTSSEVTAKYKSSIISGDSLIDITGGFGVDAYFFAQKCKEVTHCELNTKLSTIVNNNYQQLKINNIKLFSGNGIDFLKKTTKTFDWIYIDPSRRNETNNKVFLLKDCLPNVPENLNFLFSKSKNILIKNSPILDISKTIEELNFVKEIHIIAVNNDVKELLFILEKNYKDDKGKLVIPFPINFDITDEQVGFLKENTKLDYIILTKIVYLNEMNNVSLSNQNVKRLQTATAGAISFIKILDIKTNIALIEMSCTGDVTINEARNIETGIREFQPKAIHKESYSLGEKTMKKLLRKIK